MGHRNTKEFIGRQHLEHDETNYDLVSGSDSGFTCIFLIVLCIFLIIALLILFLEIKFGKRLTVFKNQIQEKLLTLERAIVLETSSNQPIYNFDVALGRLINPEAFRRLAESKFLFTSISQGTTQQVLKRHN